MSQQNPNFQSGGSSSSSPPPLNANNQQNIENNDNGPPKAENRYIKQMAVVMLANAADTILNYPLWILSKRLGAGLGFPEKMKDYYKGGLAYWGAGVPLLYVEDFTNRNLTSFRERLTGSDESSATQMISDLDLKSGSYTGAQILDASISTSNDDTIDKKTSIEDSDSTNGLAYKRTQTGPNIFKAEPSPGNKNISRKNSIDNREKFRKTKSKDSYQVPRVGFAELQDTYETMQNPALCAYKNSLDDFVNNENGDERSSASSSNKNSNSKKYFIAGDENSNSPEDKPWFKDALSYIEDNTLGRFVQAYVSDIEKSPNSNANKNSTSSQDLNPNSISELASFPAEVEELYENLPGPNLEKVIPHPVGGVHFTEVAEQMSNYNDPNILHFKGTNAGSDSDVVRAHNPAISDDIKSSEKNSTKEPESLIARFLSTETNAFLAGCAGGLFVGTWLETYITQLHKQVDDRRSAATAAKNIAVQPKVDAAERVVTDAMKNINIPQTEKDKIIEAAKDAVESKPRGKEAKEAAAKRSAKSILDNIKPGNIIFDTNSGKGSVSASLTEGAKNISNLDKINVEKGGEPILASTNKAKLPIAEKVIANPDIDASVEANKAKEPKNLDKEGRPKRTPGKAVQSSLWTTLTKKMPPYGTSMIMMREGSYSVCLFFLLSHFESYFFKYKPKPDFHIPTTQLLFERYIQGMRCGDEKPGLGLYSLIYGRKHNVEKSNTETHAANSASTSKNRSSNTSSKVVQLETKRKSQKNEDDDEELAPAEPKDLDDVDKMLNEKSRRIRRKINDTNNDSASGFSGGQRNTDDFMEPSLSSASKSGNNSFQKSDITAAISSTKNYKIADDNQQSQIQLSIHDISRSQYKSLLFYNAQKEFCVVICSSLIFTTMSTAPMVIASRQQADLAPFKETVLRIYEEGGFRAFFKGFAPRLVSLTGSVVVVSNVFNIADNHF